MFPVLTRLSIPNCISIGSAVFAQLMTESLYFTNHVINVRLKILITAIKTIKN